MLVGGGAYALGVTDSEAPTAAPAAVSPKQAGNVEAIYAAARESVVSIKTGSGSGTGFVVDSDGTVVTNAHVVGSSSTVEVEFADDETARASVTGVDQSSDLAVLKVDTNRPLKALQLADSSAGPTGRARGRDRLAVRALADGRRPGSCPAPAATSRRRTASRSTR